VENGLNAGELTCYSGFQRKIQVQKDHCANMAYNTKGLSIPPIVVMDVTGGILPIIEYKTTCQSRRMAKAFPQAGSRTKSQGENHTFHSRVFTRGQFSSSVYCGDEVCSWMLIFFMH
jgi:hypothetical protein